MITVATKIQAPLEVVWKAFTNPPDIKQWYFASNDWCAPLAENDLQVGGKFKTRMEAKDGSFGFDFEGVYTLVEKHKRFEYSLADGRKVKVGFTQQGKSTVVTEIFDPENENPLSMQQQGWRAILDNFKKYVETNKQ